MWSEVAKNIVPNSTERWSRILAVAALAVLGLYLANWLSGYGSLLLDPHVQNNDTRITLFPFHQYGSGQHFRNDPVAQEMLGFSPPPIRWIYRVSVPFFGVLVSAKIVQAICLGFITVAGWLLARRQGVAAGVLLVFLFLHEVFVLRKIAGGLPRGFAFPCLALWIVGSVNDQPWVRRGAAVLAALTYPPALLLILAAEGMHEALGLKKATSQSIFSAARRYALLVVFCFLVISPLVLLENPVNGSVHSLDEARADPAFGPQGRLKVLPFQDPVRSFLNGFLSPFRPQGRSPLPALLSVTRVHEERIALAGLATCILLVVVRGAPFPRAALSLLIASIALYLIARVLAFHLYSPIRFPDFGARASSLALILASAGLVAHRRESAQRNLIRGITVCLVVLGIWLGLGDGIKRLGAIGVIRVKNNPMLEFVASLPSESRIAAHPRDADNVPLFAQRSVVVSYETLQPWFKASWARQRQRAEATLDALYAAELQEVLDYAEAYGVTHFLIRRGRYRHRIRAKASTFQPLTDYARKTIGRREPEAFLFSNPPREAVVYDRGPYLVVEVAALREVARRAPA